MRFGCFVCVLLMASLGWSADAVTVAPAMSSTAVLDSSASIVIPPSPYADLEQIPSNKFQNVVVRAERALKNSLDSTLPKKVRDFAKAAYYYYREDWDSAYAAYDSLRSTDPQLTGDVILRMAQSVYRKGDYRAVWETLKLGKGLEKDEKWQRVSSRLRIEAAMADSTLSDRAHADSLKVFLDKYSKSSDADVLK